MRPTRQALTALAFVAVTIVPAPASAGAAYPAPLNECIPAVVDRGAGWMSVGLPEFSETLSDRAVGTQFGVDPVNPARMMVAGRNELYRTVDGGCSWAQVPIRANGLPAPLCNSDSVDLTGVDQHCFGIYELDVSVLNGKPRVYLQAHLGEPPGVRSVVLLSEDWGESWKTLGPLGEDLTAGTGPLVVAPGDPNTIYLMRGPQGSVGSLETVQVLVSQDGGASWSRTVAASEDIVGLKNVAPAVSPLNPKEVWAIGYLPRRRDSESSARPESLLHSSNAGAAWEVVEGSPVRTETSTSLHDVAAQSGPDGSISLALSATNRVFISHDKGTTWGQVYYARSPQEAVTQGVEFGSRPDFLFIVTTWNNILRFDMKTQRTTFVKDRPFGQEPGDQSGLYAPRFVPGAGFYALGECKDTGCGSLYRYTGKGTATTKAR